ncbi:tetratricopeptide repeat protein [Corallincola spongiicola]|uniref:Tetratricopeptide repeat protein n=1 Tax=Corallincola spongiicola TaxID=2520508 RepID=A0ABY1WSI3_9GAMM|nr:tetratricopeptide repeat protein [Corallincola spongiicola]TAA47698.1 tetratricopeptide repeat protein [Corallincola spongiicola]
MIRCKALLCACILAVAFSSLLPVSGTVYAAEKKSDPVAEKHKKRKTYLLSPKIGKKVTKAFEEYSTNNNVDAAIAILNEVAEKARQPYDVAYVDRFLGNMYALQEGGTAKAVKHLAAAVKLDVLNTAEQAQSLRLLADLQMQDEKYADAISSYDAWMDFTGKQEVSVFLRKAQGYYQIGRYAEMIAPIDQAIAIADKPEKNAYVLKLSSYYEQKDFNKSVKVLEQLVSLFPEDKRWWPQLGMFYMMVDEYTKALATMELAYKQDILEKPNEIKALAQLYATNGMPYKSAVIQDKYLKSGLLERNEQSLSVLANTWHSAKEIGRAAEYYKAVAEMTDKPDYWRKLANLQLQNQNYSAAVEAYNKALELGAKDPGRIYMSLVEAFLYQNKYRDAYASVLKAKEYPNTKKSATSWTAYIREKAGRNGVKL